MSFFKTYWRLREKVNAALRRAGLPAGPKQLLYNVQTGERLVRRLDVDREWVRSTTAHLAVHIDWFYGQEPDCCWTTRRRRQQPPVAALHIDFMPDQVK